MALLKGNPEYLLAFNGSRLIIRVNLDYIVIAVLLGFEDFQGGSYPGAMTPSDTSLLMILAVELSHTSDREMKSPKEDIRSAPLALA